MSLTERTAWDCNQKRIEWTSPSMMGDPWMLMIQPSWWSLHNGEPLYIHEHIIYLVNPDEPWVCPRKFMVRESLATDPCHEYIRNVLATQCDQGEKSYALLPTSKITCTAIIQGWDFSGFCGVYAHKSEARAFCTTWVTLGRRLGWSKLQHNGLDGCFIGITLILLPVVQLLESHTIDGHVQGLGGTSSGDFRHVRSYGEKRNALG